MPKLMDRWWAVGHLAGRSGRSSYCLSIFWNSGWLILLIALGSVSCRVNITATPQTVASAVSSPSAPLVAAPPVALPSPTPRPATPTATTQPAPTEPAVALPTRRPTASPTPKPTSVFLPPANSVPTHIQAPTIDLDAPVKVMGWTVVEQADGEQISTWVVPDQAAGWHENSARPGQGSSVVLSGHHNLGSEVFRDLIDLQPGDEIILQADSLDYHYRVTDRFILSEQDVSEAQRQQNAQWILPTIDERITLVTCWPYNTNTHRLIVVAKPVGITNLNPS